MHFDITIVIYISISFLVLIALFFINQRKSSQNKKQVQELSGTIEKLKRDIFDKDISISSYENVKQTSLIMAEIKKREILEAEIARLQRIVQDTKVIAQDASMVKKDFLTNIRHEIRTPMNSILVFSQMLEKAIEDKQLNMYARNIFNSGNNLLNLLNNIIELSEIEAGSFEVNTSAIDIKSFMSGELQKHKVQADKKSLNLVLSIADDMPESLMLDKKSYKKF
ncbi:MAG: histidine kinase dimerization/phospho-acceptor domain-containing protein [Sulfurimonas sp.]|nr:histidine kinase dimerization/phospho-acceptor domain-containing protein [Sulfurimonas sp.]